MLSVDNSHGNIIFDKSRFKKYFLPLLVETIPFQQTNALQTIKVLQDKTYKMLKCWES